MKHERAKEEAHIGLVLEGEDLLDGDDVLLLLEDTNEGTEEGDVAAGDVGGLGCDLATGNLEGKRLSEGRREGEDAILRNGGEAAGLFREG